ncbi:MAG: hypothetical protein HWN81_12710 [Candidatus Lokiarchaeota archaeon]|nr:hypothetical protein [Candidatus Lokiarchaeota archaeon]
MSHYAKQLKGSIQNVYLLLGMVFFTLGFFKLYSAIPMMIGNYYNGWSWMVSGTILLSIGFSSLYLENKLTKIKIE